MRRFVLVGPAVVLAVLVGAPPAVPAEAPVTFALLGDTPYGDTQRRAFPTLVRQVNGDKQVSFVLHAGDIKQGSASCDDARLVDLAALYGTFADPFILTPGDNDWTDCHREAAGGYLPTDRLTALRRHFYPTQGRPLGSTSLRLATQADDARHQAYRENTLFVRAGVVFSAVHVVGGDNGLNKWTGAPGGDPRHQREQAFADREAAALAWLDRTFATARDNAAAGVLLLMHGEPGTSSGYARIRAKILDAARSFGRPVLLAHGDQHRFEVEHSYGGVANLTRLETYGDTAINWLRVTADPGDRAVFRWQTRSVS